GPRARSPRRAPRAAWCGARPHAALREVDRLLLACHPPADLPRAGADGGRRLGARGGGGADGQARQEGVRRHGRGRAGAGRLAGGAHTRGDLPQRARRQAPRGVVRREDGRARLGPRQPRRPPGTARALRAARETRLPPARVADRARARPVPRAARRHRAGAVLDRLARGVPARAPGSRHAPLVPRGALGHRRDRSM
ncbi:MAG: Transcriptional regulator, PadR family, partial [uncultured Nocardioides sp.]